MIWFWTRCNILSKNIVIWLFNCWEKDNSKNAHGNPYNFPVRICFCLWHIKKWNWKILFMFHFFLPGLSLHPYWTLQNVTPMFNDWFVSIPWLIIMRIEIHAILFLSTTSEVNYFSFVSSNNLPFHFFLLLDFITQHSQIMILEGSLLKQN